jgi:aryl-alcohol dehydrogenase-like predicted oxidoreductase
MPASTSMRYRVLGRSGVSVSELCLGTMMFGGPTDEAESRRIVDHAAEHGVNFIDTANVYTDGRSEEIVGRAVKAKRDHWVVATKLAQPTGGKGPNDRGLSRRHMLRAAEDSLKRLGTDTIDLYYTHRIDTKLPFDEMISGFGDLIRAGKIRSWGLSNARSWHIADIAHICRSMNVPPPVALQPYYNLMTRQPETELIPAAKHFGLGVVPYSPIARGILSGKYQLNVAPPADSRAGRKDSRMMNTEWRPESLEISNKLKAHAEARGATLVHWATAWVLNNGGVSSAIAGPRTFEQWTGYLGALAYKWTPEDEALADSLVATGHPSTPGYNDPQYPIDGRFARVGAGKVAG